MLACSEMKLLKWKANLFRHVWFRMSSFPSLRSSNDDDENDDGENDEMMPESEMMPAIKISFCSLRWEENIVNSCVKSAMRKSTCHF